MAEIHDAESSDEGEWNGDAGDDGGPNVSQESENHEDDEQDGVYQRDFHVADGSPNSGGAVHGDGEMQRGRKRGANEGQEGHDAVDRLNHVGVGLAENGHEEARFSVGGAESAGSFARVHELRN